MAEIAGISNGGFLRSLSDQRPQAHHHRDGEKQNPGAGCHGEIPPDVTLTYVTDIDKDYRLLAHILLEAFRVSSGKFANISFTTEALGHRDVGNKSSLSLCLCVSVVEAHIHQLQSLSARRRGIAARSHFRFVCSRRVSLAKTSMW
jgi:hypothetical protein